MSSMKAACADGYYFGPNSQTKRGGHHLGKRAKKLKSDGILVVRFEMPFHVTCMGCGKTIAKGVRFNAEKKKVGAYYSTSIYSFQMRAPCCSCVIEIRTDPKNTDYSVITGAKRKVDSLDAQGVQTLVLLDEEEREQEQDPFEKLEKDQEQLTSAKKANDSLQKIEDWNAHTKRNDYDLNRTLRRENRLQRGKEKALAKEAQAFGLHSDILLYPQSKEDIIEAANVQFKDTSGKQNRRLKRKLIRSQSIFSEKKKKLSNTSSAKSSAERERLKHIRLSSRLKTSSRIGKQC